MGAASQSLNQVSAGLWHSCWIRSNVGVVCWGRSNRGQADAPSGSFRAVSAGATHTCAIRSGGTVTCWGNNQHGQTEAPPGRFVAVAAGGISISGGHSCGVHDDDTATMWSGSRRTRSMRSAAGVSSHTRPKSCSTSLRHHLRRERLIGPACTSTAGSPPRSAQQRQARVGRIGHRDRH
ncbi:hypothetical protein [Candidatus Poriferisodalis sp.]|uniref:hypothetical protein n=1 Tax=Candidatus Poriferisodalis sp. TaxID=3101277 RepID=UPI003B025B9E